MLVIIDPATDRQLVTLDAVKNELQVTGSADDAFLSDLIDQASAAIETWCNRTFATERVRETIDQSTVTDSLMISRFPVVEVYSASIAGADTDVATLEIEDGGFLYLRLRQEDRLRPALRLPEGKGARPSLCPAAWI
jgi:hypothetical protein